MFIFKGKIGDLHIYKLPICLWRFI